MVAGNGSVKHYSLLQHSSNYDRLEIT
jgi:hypothetical protein